MTPPDQDHDHDDGSSRDRDADRKQDAPAPRRIVRDDARPASAGNAPPPSADPRPGAVPRARRPKPDLRDLPPPRRDLPSNVWRADPPPTDGRRRDDWRGDEPPRHARPRPDDRREGPRRAGGDAPRMDRPGERRGAPPGGRAPAPWAPRGERFDDRRDLPPEALDDRPRHDRGPHDDRHRGFDPGPRFDRGDRGPRDDRGDRDGPNQWRDTHPRGGYGDNPHYPSGPNERMRGSGQRPDDRHRRRDDPRHDVAPPRRPPQGAAPAPRPLADPNEPKRADQRLSKVLAERGIASRREADEWIEAGWVKVDGVMAVLGARVFPHQAIEIDPAARTQQARRVTILLHKPIGYVSGQAEDGYEPASVLVTQANHWPEDPSRERWHPGHARGLAPAGRLDIDSNGLLVLTQDGRIARHLIGDDSDVEKEYLVRVEYPRGGPFPENELERLRHGLWLDGRELKPAKVSWANEDQLRFVLREGRKRQIRRMCEAVGLVVTGLKRVRIGSVVLGKLPQGQWRYLRDDERF